MESEGAELIKFEIKFRIDPEDHPLRMEWLTENIITDNIQNARRTAAAISNDFEIKEI